MSHRQEAYLTIVVFIVPVRVVDEQQILLKRHVLPRRWHRDIAPHLSTYGVRHHIHYIMPWSVSPLENSGEQDELASFPVGSTSGQDEARHVEQQDSTGDPTDRSR